MICEILYNKVRIAPCIFSTNITAYIFHNGFHQFGWSSVCNVMKLIDWCFWRRSFSGIYSVNIILMSSLSDIYSAGFDESPRLEVLKLSLGVFKLHVFLMPRTFPHTKYHVRHLRQWAELCFLRLHMFDTCLIRLRGIQAFDPDSYFGCIPWLVVYLFKLFDQFCDDLTFLLP